MALNSLLQTIENAYKKDLPFVAYRAPNEMLVKSLIQLDSRLHLTKRYGESGFVFAPFNEDKNTILIPFEHSNYAEAMLEQSNVSSVDYFDDLSNENTKESHINLVNKGIEYIKKGILKKIVLSRKEVINANKFSAFITFKKLLNSYENAFVYIWFHPKKGLWLGATPEKLISLKKKNFSTVSLAGTQAFSDLEAVNWKRKEIEEQQIVTQYITSNLASIAEDITIGDTRTVRAGNLWHLSTKIQGVLKDENDLYLAVQRLHPTPAVCGMPKLMAKKLILEHEDYDREFYTGFLGEINMDDCSNLFVNLRCMKVLNETLSLYLGGGITEESNPESEWLETVEKSKVMKRVLRN